MNPNYVPPDNTYNRYPSQSRPTTQTTQGGNYNPSSSSAAYAPPQDPALYRAAQHNEFPPYNDQRQQPQTFHNMTSSRNPQPNQRQQTVGAAQAYSNYPSSNGHSLDSPLSPDAVQGMYIAGTQPQPNFPNSPSSYSQPYPMSHVPAPASSNFQSSQNPYPSYPGTDPGSQYHPAPQHQQQEQQQYPSAFSPALPNIKTERIVSPEIPASPTSTSPTQTDRYVCDKCSRSFTRAHDRKRHYETQHLPNPTMHRCRNCDKSFSRSDSLKRHINNNGCPESS